MRPPRPAALSILVLPPFRSSIETRLLLSRHPAQAHRLRAAPSTTRFHLRASVADFIGRSRAYLEVFARIYAQAQAPGWCR